MEILLLLLIILNGIILYFYIEENKRRIKLQTRLDEMIEEAGTWRWKYLSEISKVKETPKTVIPKGTIQAVKDAMKRSHPDNGGNAEDFQMYRRAYNILIGKEKF